MMATEYNKDLICFASFIDIYGIRRKKCVFHKLFRQKACKFAIIFLYLHAENQISNNLKYHYYE